MPVRSLPSQFTAVRDLTLAGSDVAAGDTVPAADAASALGHRALEEYVSRGILKPDVPLYVQTERRAVSVRSIEPWTISPEEFRVLLSS